MLCTACVLLISTACLTRVESTLALGPRLTWTTMLISATPTTVSTGVTHSGTGTKADLDNHANQLNPNNKLYQPKGGKMKKFNCHHDDESIGIHI